MCNGPIIYALGVLGTWLVLAKDSFGRYHVNVIGGKNWCDKKCLMLYEVSSESYIQNASQISFINMEGERAWTEERNPNGKRERRPLEGKNG